MDTCSKHAIGGNAEVLYAFTHNPIMGGRYSPDFTAAGMQFTRELQHFGKDARSNYGSKELFRGFLKVCHWNAGVDRNHFAAHGFFANISGFVFVITGDGPLRNFCRDHIALDFPLKEISARVAAPERAIAIKYGDLRTQRKNGFNEFLPRRSNLDVCFQIRVLYEFVQILPAY